MIPLRFFTAYWAVWSIVTAIAVVMNWGRWMIPLAVCFLVVEILAIYVTPKESGTLTDTTSYYVTEDLTFILLSAMVWRLSEWLSGHVWIVWCLAGWLIQHFVRHYQNRSQYGR